MRLTQFWDSPIPPMEVQQLISSWSTDHRFEHELFDTAQAYDYIRTHLDADVARAFERCRPPAMKADLFRYCSLYAGGGAYVDADIRNLGSAHEFFLSALAESQSTDDADDADDAEPADGVLMFRPVQKDGVHIRKSTNDIMIAGRPRLPLFERAVQKCCSNIFDEVSENVWLVTGPGVLKRLREEEEHLFAQINSVSVRAFRPHVEFVWKMDYKASDCDWRLEARRRSGLSIFQSGAAMVASS